MYQLVPLTRFRRIIGIAHAAMVPYNAMRRTCQYRSRHQIDSLPSVDPSFLTPQHARHCSASTLYTVYDVMVTHRPTVMTSASRPSLSRPSLSIGRVVLQSGQFHPPPVCVWPMRFWLSCFSNARRPALALLDNDRSINQHGDAGHRTPFVCLKFVIAFPFRS